MNLSISTKYLKKHPRSGERTNFIAKIWNGLIISGLLTAEDKDLKRAELLSFYGVEKALELWGEYNGSIAKIHTFRGKSRFKKDTLIHFRTWTGKPYKDPTFLFTPVLKCTGTQEIKIIYGRSSIGGLRKIYIFIDNVKQGEIVTLGGVVKNCSYTVEHIINNDGFSTIEEFLEWFPDTWTGTIIHWTDKRY